MRLFSCARKSRRGLTLMDVCVVLVAFLLLAAAVPALRHNADTADKKMQCASQLKRLFIAMEIYANMNHGNYPRTFFAKKVNTNDPAGPLTEYTGANAVNSFGSPDSPAGNDVTAPIYLLIKVTGYPAESLVCPASGARPFPDKVAGHSNFPSGQYLSYSMQNPFPATSAVIMNWQWSISAMSRGGPLFSDMNPGAPELLTMTPQSGASAGNSRNHGGAGQNVLYGDGAVKWETTPFCGLERPGPPPFDDNIFTAQTTPPTISGYVQDALDAVMLPIAPPKSEMPPSADGSSSADASPSSAEVASPPPPLASSPPSSSSFPWMIASVIGVVIVLAIVVLIVVSRSRRQQ